MCTRLAGGVPVDMPLREHLGWKPDLPRLAKMDLSKVKLMWLNSVSYTHLRAHETVLDLVCRLLLEKKK